jgi:hypothetical protein
MKTKSIICFLFLLAIIPSYSAFGQKDDFSGEWKLNREKAVYAENQPFLASITIKLKSDSLLTTRIYEGGNGDQYPFEENMSLDGKETKIVIYDMPRSSKATRSKTDGSIVIESKTTFNGNDGPSDMTAKETWKANSDGKILSIDFINKMSGTETLGTNTYNKVK